MIPLLMVDDSPTILMSVGAILRKAGYAVTAAAGGEQALEALAREPVAVVLVDLKMPGMDGLELIRRIRLLDDHRFTPIVVLTTETRRRPREEARSAGATVWITKPVPPQDLLDVLARVLAPVRLGAAASHAGQ